MPSTFTNNLGTELKSGAYFITTALPSNAFIGRKLVDDKAVAEGLYASHARKLLPVVRLPEDSQDIAVSGQSLSLSSPFSFASVLFASPLPKSLLS